MVDPKTPLYRYIPFARFNQMLFSKELALMKPSKWDDEYEQYWLRMIETPSGRAALRSYAEAAPGDRQYNVAFSQAICQIVFNLKYCLCFSSQKDSEVLWRANSDGNKGIMFATTAEKLTSLFSEEYVATIKKVSYDLESNDLASFLSCIHFHPEGAGFSDTDSLLLHKRRFFSYENEVRLIVAPLAFSENEILKVSIPELSDFIDGVMVHPLATKEHVALVELLCKHFSLPFLGRSKVYDFAPL